MRPIAAPNPDTRRKSPPHPAEKPHTPRYSEESSNETPLFLRKSHEPGAAKADSQPLPNRIRAAASQGGQTLAPYLQHAFNRQLGLDASRVRIHTGGEADSLNHDLRARAFTTGRDIFFRAGEYRPDHPGGLELLAHEVVHTEQQRQGAVSTQAASDSAAISEPGDQFEQEADNAARSFVAGQTSGAVTPAKASHPVQRKCAACESGGATCPKCEEEEKVKIQRKAEPSAANSAAHFNEMIPGYQARYSAGPKTGGAMIIQRDTIDHKDVDWSDFKGNVPKKTQFEAETASGLVDPGIASAIPTTFTAVDTGEKCKLAGKDAKKFKVNIAIDPAKIRVKSFMERDDSWHKAWATDPDARKDRCLKEMSPQCEASFDDQFTKAKKDRDANVKTCQKGFDDAGAQADSMCKGQDDVKSCKEKVLKDFGVKMGSLKASSRADCASVGDTNEKSRKDAAIWTGSLAGASATVKKRDDCRKPAFLDPCVKDLMEADSKRLLTHEQNHFHLSAAMAAKAEQDLRAMAKAFPKEVTACGEKEAKDLAKKTVDDEAKKLDDGFKAAKKQLKDMQAQYDAESKHGALPGQQKDWQDKIAKGFTTPTP